MGEMNIQKVMAAILESLTDAQKEQVKACKDTNELIAKLSEMGVAVPDDARGFSGEMEGASAVAVNPEDFAAVSAVEITFDYLSPETVAARQAEAE